MDTRIATDVPVPWWQLQKSFPCRPNPCGPLSVLTLPRLMRSTLCLAIWDLYSAYVDYLYWKVNRSELSQFDFEKRELHVPQSKYDSNWRIGGSICCKGYDLGFRYTNFDLTQKKRTDKFNIDFNSDDIEVGYRLAFDCFKVNLSPLEGLPLSGSTKNGGELLKDCLDATVFTPFRIENGNFATV